MNAMAPAAPAGAPRTVLRGIVARFAQIALVLVVQAAALFLGAGRFAWKWAWVYLGITLAFLAVNGTLMLRRSPETVAERGRPGEMRGWDRIVSGLWSLIAFLAVPLVAGLDARGGWTGPVATMLHVGGAVAVLAGYELSGWAMAANTFFSTAVRIQRERGHTVCTTGPYRVVRHPGYLGFTLQTLAVPVLLGSAWSLLPAIIAGALLAVRTLLEDRVLQAELPGYREYAARVRWRLVPGIW
jgi:protein-S-isoprenylcysteine O-methyltransferase Ste14